ncbi:Arc family DNA-binding protein [Pirellulaceae bacterium SH449]
MAKRDSFLLRLSPDVLASVRRWAEDELRSTNAQIEMILVQALRESGRHPKPPAPPECPAPPAPATQPNENAKSSANEASNESEDI